MTSLAVQQTRASPFDANLRALARRSPRAAEQVRLAFPRTELSWIETLDRGAPSADLAGRALASKRRPLAEAASLADAVDLKGAAGIVVLGFGLGYHIAELCRRGGARTAFIVFEPDVNLLRSVLERIDCSSWLASGNVTIVTEPEPGAIAQALSGLEGFIAAGTHILEHPPSAPRLGESARRFGELFARAMGSVRTQVITTMVHMEVTVRNLLMNIDHYCFAGGLGELAGAGTGVPAIVVSAGPSLERNIALLEDPALRNRAVIIAVQTVLKPLLARGIRPHFVTALDYHEISRRFYEGLAPADVEGVTLIAEPKANPAILDSFPGAIRVAGAEFLDLVLGEQRSPRHAAIKPGATVAHLAYTLARHLACDPVILIGQDLAFTDGQYYSNGAVIHDVWGPELNEFNTLEMMEWQRIVRWRGHLHRITDVLGRPVYTDDQMRTYLSQFERDFLEDRDRGLTTIDATEGGARKAHTQVMNLRDALDIYAPPGGRTLAPFPHVDRRDEPGQSAALRSHLQRVRAGVVQVAQASREAAELLGQMIEVAGDPARVNELIDHVHSVRGRVEQIQPAYGLVHRLNQAGAFKRFRADRALTLDEGLTPAEVQRRQIERDLINVTWLGDSADSLADLLDAAARAIDGAPKRTRDIAPAPEQVTAAPRSKNGARAVCRTGAVVFYDTARSGLGTARPGSTIAGVRPERLTLDRLALCKRLDRIIVVTPDPIAVRDVLPPAVSDPHIEVVAQDAVSSTDSCRSIAAARLWARACWRGGLGAMTCYDEVFDPRRVSRVLELHSLDAALILGLDWCFIDPSICDALIERHAENPEVHPLAFSQAAPGLSGLVIGARLCEKLARGREAGDHFATLGGVLGYHPMRPQTDPIAGSMCVQIDPAVRAAMHRFIPDSPAAARLLDAALAPHSARLAALSAAEIVRAFYAALPAAPVAAPEHLCIELCAPDGRRAPTDSVAAVLDSFASLRPDGAVTFFGREDPLSHSDLPALVSHARARGLAGIHVRTPLCAPIEGTERAVAAGADVVSVDVHAMNEAAFLAISGRRDHGAVIAGIDRLLALRRREGGLPHPWVVPRLTRRDEVYEQLEHFFDRSLFIAGAGVIDPLPAAIPGARIGPLRLPPAAATRAAMTRLSILCDGTALGDESDRESGVANALHEGLEAAWQRIAARRAGRAR